MDNRGRMALARLLVAAGLLAGAPSVVHAGLVTIWRLSDIAAAPVLVVGRVVRVETGDPVPNGALSGAAQMSNMAAEIEVLRSWRNSGGPLASNRVQVHFLAYEPSGIPLNGAPFPEFKPGEVLALPLKDNAKPSLEPWNLVGDSGLGLVVPALADMPASDAEPDNSRAFLDREIGNALSRGSPQEVLRITGYLAMPGEDLSGELTPLLESAVGDDRSRWAEIATSLLATQGIPQPSVAELLSGMAQPKGWPFRGGLFLAQVALQKLKASPETDALLIATAITDIPLDAWGSANVLRQYADNPATTEGVRKALRDDVTGSSFAALTMVRAGQTNILPEALARAFRIVDRPDGDYGDLQGAAALLRDYGSDQDLKQLAALVRKYQTQNVKFYSTLWQYATEGGNPREARVLAVVLQDRRVSFGDYRYCDIAVGVLGRAAKQDFVAGAKTLQERDDAVARALAWIAAQGLTQ